MKNALWTAALLFACACEPAATPPVRSAGATEPARQRIVIDGPFVEPAAVPDDEAVPVDASLVPADVDPRRRSPTPLHAARVPFANYLGAIHQRIHPIFADTFLASLDKLPSSDPRNGLELQTTVEIVIRDDGNFDKWTVVKSSGVSAFDAGVLDSLQKAAPFPTPPPEVLSRDGKVYIQWALYRNPYYACSTYFARPFLYK